MNSRKFVIELQDVTFSYGSAPALERVNLNIEEGEFLGIVGPNAGGKSTLLKLILGLLSPQFGKVHVLGQSPRVATRFIGYVPQHPGFSRDFPISVEQTVLMGRLGGSSWLGSYSNTDRRVMIQTLEEVEAKDLAKRLISSLSGGQLQRVLLARALVSEPRILILDEPTANIDQRLENDIFALLRRLSERMTVLVVSHDVGFISSYVNRVACVNRTLVCHSTNAIDGQVIKDLYGENMHMVVHQHSL